MTTISDMTDFADLYPKILNDVPDCTEPVAREKLLEAAINFCRTTGLWKSTMAPVTLYEDQKTYPIVYPDHSIPERIDKARIQIDSDVEPIPLEPMSDTDLKRHYAKDWESIKGVPKFYTHIETNRVIQLVPFPNEDFTDGLLLRLQLVPSFNATKIPTFIFEQYWMGLAAATRQLLFRMEGQPWTDHKQANVERVTASRELGVGIQDGAGSHTTKPQFMSARFPLA